MMKDRLDSIYMKYKNMGKTIFFIAFIIELIVMMLGHTAFTIPYVGRILHIAFVLFAVKVCLTKYTQREWILIIILGVIGTVSYVSMGDEWVIRIIMMIIASKDIDTEEVVRYAFWISLIGTIIIIGLSLLGIGGQIVDVRDYGRGTIESRWCLGFSHANNLHGTIWYVLSLGLLHYLNKFRWYHGVILTIGNVGLYLMTLSRAGIIVIEAVIFAALIYVYVPRMMEWKWMYGLGLFGMLLLVGLSIYTVAFGSFGPKGNQVLQKISDLCTGRLEMLTWYEKMEDWSLFGDGRARISTDVGFITIVSEYGYVILGLYLLCIILMIHSYCLNRKWMEFFVLMTCVFYTFMESTYTINVYLLCNFVFVLLLGNWNHLFKKEKEALLWQKKN